MPKLREIQKMKNPLDPRHLRRKKTIKSLFGYSFRKNQHIESKLAKKIIGQVKEIDKIIEKAAPEWPIIQINKVDLAILRLAVYEMIIIAKEPEKVIIDEAVELAKTYGAEKSPAFVNGVLGTVLKNYEKK